MANEIDQLIREKRLYFVGDKLPSDFYEAVRLWLPLAEAGDPKAQYNIARCYHNGDGVDKDSRKAFELYIKASNQRESRSFHNLSLMYEAGEACEKNTAKAQEMMDKAAELGEVRALCKQADAAFAQRDIEKARSLYKKGAEQGHSRSEIGVIACDLKLSAEYQGYKVSGYSSRIVEGSTSTTSHSAPSVKILVSNKSSCAVRVKFFMEEVSHDEKKQYGTNAFDVAKNDTVGLQHFLNVTQSHYEEKLIGMEVNGEDFSMVPVVLAEWADIRPTFISWLLVTIMTTAAVAVAILAFDHPHNMDGLIILLMISAAIAFFPALIINGLKHKLDTKGKLAKRLAFVN